MIRSVSPYGNRKLYLLDGSKEKEHQILYSATQSYNSESESYDDPAKYFLDSPIEEHESSHEPESLLSESFEGLSYDEDKMRSKLQELEQAQLDDSGPSQIMDIETDWGYSVLESPKESSSNESYVSSINSNKEVSLITQSYNSESESYDDPAKYFLDSPIEEHESNHEPESLLSENFEGLSYDEDKMRSELQELEQALPDDSGPSQIMDIETDWGYSVLESPKESSSNESYVSSINSNKEVSLITPKARATTPKDLLFECAVAVSEGNIEVASYMINELRQTVSIDGEPLQRILAYMVEALAARVAVSGKGLYRALKCKEPPSKDRLSAMQVLFEVCPCFRFGFMAANGAILDSFIGEKSVHIIDFDINQGSQYITLLQTLAGQSGQQPHLRLTGVDDPESVQRPVGGLNHIGLRLKELAKSLNLDFEFNSVAADTTLIEPQTLNCRPGEAVIVNFAFQLHHMPDESVSTVNQRDQLLRMVKSLNPKLVTVVEQDVNTNTAPFLHRFHEAYTYYSAMFDCLDATLPRESQERVNVEKQCLARDIVNIIACEGEERIERYEVSGKWKARMTMAGFRANPISENVNDMIRKLIQQYSQRYKMKAETNAVHFGWEDKVLIVASAWR